jgi:hypothetical protein
VCNNITFYKIIICDQAFLMKIYMETKLLAINLIFIHFDMIFLTEQKKQQTKTIMCAAFTIDSTYLRDEIFFPCFELCV